MKAIVHEKFRLRAGMRILLAEGPAVVERVNGCAAVCRLEGPRVRQFTTISGCPVRIEARGKLVRISPNSEVQVL